MIRPIVPQNFQAKAKVDLGKYTLELITVKDLEEDFKIIKENAEIITKLRGGSRSGWPFKCTLEEDYKDLAWLEVCASYHQLFCYIIRNKKDEYIGAIYIYPIELFFPKKADKFDIDLNFWITQKTYDQGSYPEIFQIIVDWIKSDWSFISKRIFYRNYEIPKAIKF